ncbi:hypothetical protein [Bremerella alba]|uniref:Uncharacterized protein n=1 Tax=Bremerella alba TaxID=980252 RepID=A0A7V8V8D2_9BACT|nr:hypothetical protein [Bremerella alba]MBA2116823.1 hypothetical protein [Bremerella alba]
MDAVSHEGDYKGRFLNLVAHPLEDTPSDLLAEPFAELAFTADYERSELFVSQEAAERQALEHNSCYEAKPEAGWLMVAQILKELDAPVRVQVRPDGLGGGTLEVTRSYAFRLACSKDEAQETTPQLAGDCS